MKNSYVFDVIVCRIFDVILNSFPRKSTLSLFDITRDIDFEREELKDCFFNVISWLVDNGYIITKSREISDSECDFVFPTEKMLAVMDAVPSSLSGKGKSLGEYISECLASGTTEAMKDAVKCVMAAGLSFIVKQ